MKSKQNISIRKSIATKLLKIVFSFYLVIAIFVTIVHMAMEYRYQKKDIQNNLIDIQSSFEQNLALDIWQINKKSLHSTVEGMVKIPEVVGVKIQDASGTNIASGCISSSNGTDKSVIVDINPLGLDQKISSAHLERMSSYNLFQHQFPITYDYLGETKILGEATIYSSSSVVLKRVKLGFMLLIINAFVKTAALWVIFLMFSNYLIRKPLTSLANAAENISLENLDSYNVNVNTSGRNELKVLEESFNSMIGNLHQSLVKNKSLEGEILLTKFAVDHISDAAFWINEDGSFAFVNQAASNSLEYSRAELLTMSVLDVDPNFPAEAWSAHWDDIKIKGSVKIESLHRTKNGRTFPVEIVTNFMKFEDKEYNCAFVRDISDRKAMELQLQQAQKMEAIGTLAGGIAHDFNNILTAIIGYTELVGFKLKEGSEAKTYQQEILNAGGRAKELVKQILTFSRKAEHQQTSLQIHLVVKEALKLLRASIPKTIEFNENIDTKCGTILADPTQIHQIVMNLCTNAYHAMRETGGVLTVELSKNEINKQDIKVLHLDLAPGSYLVLKIIDSGSGMDSETINRIYEPYFTTKKFGEGTGMGLSVTHGIVKSHGGDISVKSEPGKGTSFDIYFPKLTTPSLDTYSEKNGDLPLGNETVLIVDDEEIIINVEQQILESLGYKVTSMLDSNEALQIFSSNPNDFDLVITDMTMPNMTGAELSKRMLAIRPDIPIILCTGFSDSINELKAKEMGIRGYFLKPIVQSKLAKLIRKVLNSS